MRKRKIRNVWKLKRRIAYCRENKKKKVTFSKGEKESVVRYEEDRL